MSDMAQGGVERQEHTAALFRVIEKHVSMALSVVVPTDVLYEIAAHYIPRRYANPYFPATEAAIIATALDQADNILPFPQEPIDFIFDMQTEMGPCMEAWQYLYDRAPERAKPFLGQPPIFRDEKTTLPL
jgi:hypothetical protein